MVKENLKQTARELAKQFNTCYRTIITQLNELGKVSKLSLLTSTELLSRFPREIPKDHYHINSLRLSLASSTEASGL